MTLLSVWRPTCAAMRQPSSPSTSLNVPSGCEILSGPVSSQPMHTTQFPLSSDAQQVEKHPPPSSVAFNSSYQDFRVLPVTSRMFAFLMCTLLQYVTVAVSVAAAIQ